MIEILRKSSAALIVLTLALVAQMPHAAYVFAHAPNPDATVGFAEWLLASSYAIAVESATLMFVLHKRTVASYCFAVASFAVNMSYYSMHGVELWQLSAFPAWLLSALLPTAIASYSHILNGATESATRTTHFMQWWRRLYALQWWRQSATQTSQPEVQNDATQNPVQHTTAPDDATDSTTDARAQALAMHANQMSASEIARLLQQKESTVRSWIRRNGHKEVA